MTEGALVLEGGSLRCLFTSGVIDTLIEQDIELSYVNGVSAGSMCGMNYVSKQVGRTRKINIEYVRDKRYLSFRNMMKNRLIFNFEFLFGELSQTLVPFDFETFHNSSQRFTAVATRCKTGQPEYFEKGVCEDIISAVQASSSMPVLSKMVMMDGKKYLDGGVSMPIAYQKALDEGYGKIVVVLTREQGYRKTVVSKWTQKAYDRYFEPLPEFLASLNEVPQRYNRMQEELEELEAQGRIFIIRPSTPVLVSRVEKDVRKLEALYQAGRQAAESAMPALKAYLYGDEKL